VAGYKELNELLNSMSAPEITGINKDGILAASVEAENAPTKFNPRERAVYVRGRIDEIRSLVALGKNDIEIKAAVGDFVEQYPTLFQYSVRSDFDYKQLEMMLSLLTKMSGGMTQHKASIAVGQTLVDKYVKPMLK
jgi:hypothetical protein